jgi:hypothetical protein
MNWILSAIVVTFALAAVFWVRGIWKNALLDRSIGIALLAVTCVEALSLGSSTSLLNDVGLWLMGLGVVTAIVARLGKRTSVKQADLFGVLLAVLGLFLVSML